MFAIIIQGLLHPQYNCEENWERYKSKRRQREVDFGFSQIRPDSISAQPINKEWNEIEIVIACGGIDIYKQVVELLKKLLYLDAT